MISNEESLKLLIEKHKSESTKRGYKLHLYLSDFSIPRTLTYKTLQSAKLAAEKVCQNDQDEAIIICAKEKTCIFKKGVWNY